MKRPPPPYRFARLALCCVLGLALSGCQTAQHLVAFTEARRDPQLAEMFGARLALEERYRKCRLEHAADHAEACAGLRADLDDPLSLSAVPRKAPRRNWLVRPKSTPGG